MTSSRTIGGGYSREALPKSANEQHMYSLRSRMSRASLDSQLIGTIAARFFTLSQPSKTPATCWASSSALLTSERPSRGRSVKAPSRKNRARTREDNVALRFQLTHCITLAVQWFAFEWALVAARGLKRKRQVHSDSSVARSLSICVPSKMLAV